MSASGRFVALRRPGAVEVVDVQGTAPRHSFALADGGDFAIAGSWVCLVDHELRAERLDGSGSGSVALEPGRVRAFGGRAADAILVGDTLVELEPRPRVTARAGAGTRWFPLAGRSMVATTGGRLAILTTAKSMSLNVPLAGEIAGVAPLFGGRLIALLVASHNAQEVLVVQASGSLVHRIHVPAARWHAFAPARGQLLLGSGGDDVIAVDLRLGRVCGQGRAPHAISELAVDDDGRDVAIASPTQNGIPVVSVLRCEDLLGRDPVAITAEPSPPVAVEPVASAPPRPDVQATTSIAPLPEAPLLDLVPYAFGLPPAPLPDLAPSDAAPFAHARDHLSALVDLVAARAAMAIAEAWHSGRISADGAGQLPFEREVLGLSGESCGLAADRVAAATTRLDERAATLQARSLATLRAGIALPFVAVAQELALSETATQVLLGVLAPQVNPEIARLYRILANHTGPAICDDALVCQLLAAGDSTAREAVLDELATDAALLRTGAVVRTANGLAIGRSLLARMRGVAIPATAATRRRTALRSLGELHVDRDAVNRLLRELAVPKPAPARVVVRGPYGSGRHAVIAAIASRVGRDLLAIDAAQLPRASFATELARELANAQLAQVVPIVSGLEVAAGADHEVTQQLRQVLAAHRGPIVVRTGLESRVPLEPGFVELVLRPLVESARQRAFAAALAEVDLPADTALLARRFRIGPGTMQRIAREARARLGRAEPTAAEATQLVDDLARQHVATRIGNTAQRVTRLADWDHVALPEDMLDSLRELVGRARHARTVYEDWGYDARITTSRGLTALFYGPPGTGKTMVAGLMARELGLELYRVDLSKVMSKWVGETEKNLGEVFDAAEDGQVMLLFDEADSLFAKRSEVKSSNDRYANLEVNYLLQRLDSFEGVAILTTNLEGSIDPAFRRRMSMRLYFPFPDEEMRARLWESHVMPRVPTQGTLDFGALARRFPLSGGYIRNSALRAAFLAAQEQTALTQAHLERAVLLEYRELGKLADNGHME